MCAIALAMTACKGVDAAVTEVIRDQPTSTAQKHTPVRVSYTPPLVLQAGRKHVISSRIILLRSSRGFLKCSDRFPLAVVGWNPQVRSFVVQLREAGNRRGEVKLLLKLACMSPIPEEASFYEPPRMLAHHDMPWARNL